MLEYSILKYIYEYEYYLGIIISATFEMEIHLFS